MSDLHDLYDRATTRVDDTITNILKAEAAYNSLCEIFTSESHPMHIMAKEAIALGRAKIEHFMQVQDKLDENYMELRR